MLTRAQQILIKRAQAEAHLDDADYRAAMAVVSGFSDCRSSTDRRLTDEHMDRLLAYFEAIYWQAIDANRIERVEKPDMVFRRRGYWAEKNSKESNSRERFTASQLLTEIGQCEAELHSFGCGFKYLQAIQSNIKPFRLHAYLAALKRTLEAKRKKVGHV